MLNNLEIIVNPISLLLHTERVTSPDVTFPFPVNLHGYEHANVFLPHLVHHSSGTTMSHKLLHEGLMRSKVRMGYSQ